MTPTLDDLAPNPARLQSDLDELATLTEPDQPGWSRVVFSDAYRDARGWVRDRMAAAGLDVTTDAAGNLIGRLPGRTNAPPLVTGSHTDTVRSGGRFDGTVGVLAGIEVARRLGETSMTLDHDLLVCDFTGEEANEFGLSCLGSRAVSGDLAPEHLERVDAAGRRLGDMLPRVGADPDRILGASWPRDRLRAYVELHVEQGSTLEQRAIPLGVVTAIAGMERLLATFTGQTDHAGARSMGQRRDALAAAAAAVLAIEKTGRTAPVPAVATAGRLEADPGLWNVVPGSARMWAEYRSVDAEWLTGARPTLADDIAACAADRGVEVRCEWFHDGSPVPAAQSVQNAAGQAADALGVSWMAMPSGAYHDAAHLAHLGPMGMIFIPSRGGRSHCPDEWTDLTDIVTGTHVLAATLLQLDASE